MKIQRIPCITCLLLFFAASTACKKSVAAAVVNANPSIAASPVNPGYNRFIILRGQQFAENTSFLVEWVNTSDLHFKVIFDSTAIYKTDTASNQDDINKLYGFADNNANDHHLYSARIGWNWYHNQLNLYGYIYNSGVMSFTKLGPIAIGKPVDCHIIVKGSQYLFVVNGVTTAMPRASTTATGIGYKLFPYFGGTENAPHVINIDIDEVGE